MSISTLQLYESLLKHDRPLAWWGLDTAGPTVDDSGHGYTLTAVGAPADAATLLTRGDDGASGSRDFDGTADAYYTLGTLYEAATETPTYTGIYSYASSGGGITNVPLRPGLAATETPGYSAATTGTRSGDLMLAVINTSVGGATVSSAPAGWTQIGSTLNYTAGTMAAYRRTADATDEQTPLYTWVWSSAGDVTGLLGSWRGMDPSVATLIFDSGIQATASGTDHSTTTETTPAAARHVVFWAGDGFDIAHQSATGGELRLAGIVQGAFGAGSTRLLALDYEVAAGDPGRRTASTSSATQLGAAFFTFGSAPVVSENALDTIAETISIHALIRPDTITGTDTIIRKHQAWGLHLVDGVVTFVYRDGGGVDRSVAGPTVTAGVMSQLVVIDDGTNINFYLNGTKTSAARVGTAGYTQNAFRVQLGAYFDEATNSNFFDGRMDEVAVWNQPLTQQMVLAYWQAATEGTFGTVMLGSPKYPRLKLEMAFASDPTDDCLSFEDVTAYMRRCSTRRGRNFERDRIETGTMSFDLSDRTRAFDDTNTASPFYPNVKPTRPVRLRAQTVTNGVVYPIFSGYTEGHPLKRSSAGLDEVAVFTASDSFKALVLNVIASGERPQERSGSRLAAILEDVPGVPYSGDGGQVDVAAVADLAGTNRLEHAQAVASDTENGTLFADASGVVVFQDHHYRTKNERTVRATYGANELPFTNLEPLFDEARLFTAGAITPAVGVVQVSENAAASRAHFKRTKEVSTLHVLENDALALSQLYANGYSVPRTRIPEIALAPALIGASMWTVVLSHEISHRIKTIDRPFGATVSREHFVEGIRHDIAPDDWRVILNVSPAELDGDFLLIGTGTIGTDGGATSARIGL